MGEVNRHFVELRREIRKKVRDKYGEAELAKYPRWLYGALGDPNADVMFVCENPSEKGVRLAHARYRRRGIEAQWRGHPADRFRRVLCQTGLKCGEPDEGGGWRCYITNVIKEMWMVKNFNEDLTLEDKTKMACHWAGVLQWEIRQVRPEIVFCVGQKAEWAMRLLAKKGCINLGKEKLRRIWHYSARGTNAFVRGKMRKGILDGLRDTALLPAQPCNPPAYQLRYPPIRCHACHPGGRPWA